MNTNYAREFLVFAQSMNYSEAARDLFISRSTLRDHIAELEFELKVPLIDKAGEGTRLTVYGRRFLTSARELCQHADAILQEFEDLKNNYLNVRVSYSTLSWLRMYLLRARMNVVAAHPEKTIELTTVGSPSVTRSAIDNGSFDLAIFRVDVGVGPEERPELFEGLAFQKLSSSRILFFTGVENPLTAKEEVHLADLAGQTLLVPSDIYHVYLEHPDTREAFGMHLASLDFNDFLEYYMADYSRRIGTVPENLVREYGLQERVDCKILNVVDFNLMSDFYLACSTEFLKNPTAALLFEELCRLLRETPLTAERGTEPRDGKDA